MTLFPFLHLSWDVQLMIAGLAVIVLLGPVASILRNPRKYGRLAVYIGLGFLAAYGLPALFERNAPLLGEASHLQWLLVPIIWLAVSNLLRASRKEEE